MNKKGYLKLYLVTNSLFTRKEYHEEIKYLGFIDPISSLPLNPRGYEGKRMA